MVTFGLTKKGEAKINEILTILFEYIEKIKKNGIPDYVIEDIKKIHDLRFKFMEFGSASQRFSCFLRFSCFDFRSFTEKFCFF